MVDFIAISKGIGKTRIILSHYRDSRMMDKVRCGYRGMLQSQVKTKHFLRQSAIQDGIRQKNQPQRKIVGEKYLQIQN